MTNRVALTPEEDRHQIFEELLSYRTNLERCLTAHLLGVPVFPFGIKRTHSDGLPGLEIENREACEAEIARVDDSLRVLAGLEGKPS